MSVKKWPDRLYALDFSRGLAAISVVLWHWKHFAYKGSSLSNNFIRENQPLYEILKLFYEKGAAGVEYFFLLSGFIFFWLYRKSISERNISVKTFIVNRFSRLYPLHFITLIIVAFMQFIYISRESSSFVYPFNDIYHFVLHIGFASNWGFEKGWSFNAPVWSVSIEILLYIVFFLTAFFKRGGILFSLSVSIGSYILFVLINNMIFIGLVLFFLGGVVFQLTSLISTKYRFLKIPIYSVSLTAWLCIIFNYYIFDLSGLIFNWSIVGRIFIKGFSPYFIFPLTICSLVLFEIDNFNFFKPFSVFGDISYSVYLLHFPLQLSFVLVVSFGIADTDFYYNLFYFVLYFVILVPLAYIVYKRFERPMQKIIRSKFL